MVECLEKNGEGLNLTWEVRDGILNHRTSGSPHTLEGQIVRLCDKISYIHHDMDDAQRAGVITEDDIPITLRLLLGENTKERLNTFIHDIVDNSRGKDTIRMSPEIEEGLRDLRNIMFQNVYLNPVAKEEEEKAENLVEALYGYYSTKPDQMSEEYKRLLRDGEEMNRVVCDYISGMTDQYSMEKFRDIFVPKGWSVY